jgi:hypothetical protein
MSCRPPGRSAWFGDGHVLSVEVKRGAPGTAFWLNLLKTGNFAETLHIALFIIDDLYML